MEPGKLSGMRLAVTGGAGFVGSHVCRLLVDEGADLVIAFDNVAEGEARGVRDIESDRLIYVHGDIRDAGLIRQCLEKYGVHVVHHLAAELEVFSGIGNAREDAEVNILGTVNVLNASVAANVRRVVYASSGTVYGQEKILPVPESHPLEPHWPYGVSKLAGERYCWQYWALYGLETVSFRYAIVYGPGEWFGRVLTMFVKRVFIENKEPVVFGDGEQRRDYVYVEDIARAHLIASHRAGIAGTVCNLGTGVGTPVGRLAEMVIGLSGKDMKPAFDDPPEGSESLAQPGRKRLVGELRDLVLDSTLAGDVLGWKAETPLAEGLGREVQWICGNPGYWDTSPRV